MQHWVKEVLNAWQFETILKHMHHCIRIIIKTAPSAAVGLHVA